jgi:CheY-like chemotaxis protein
MDWQLSDMDGWEATRQIRKLAQQSNLAQPTIIMVTAHGREMLAQRTAEEQDMLNGFLVKPVTAPMLFEALLNVGAGNSSLRQAAKGRSSGRQLTGMRILVVEDNLINQQVADELLSAAGAIVSLAANGQIGVDAIAAAAPQFDVVLMDIQMPVLDGYCATRAIREDLGLTQLPIIAMTANAMASDRVACLAAGMNEHVGKPFDMGTLVSLLIRTTGFQPLVGQLDGIHAARHSGSALPVVSGLDLQTAIGRMSGMVTLYVRTARDFLKIMDTIVAELQEHLTSGDEKKAMTLLHTLKGNAGTLGANDLASMAKKFEALCKTETGMNECAHCLNDFDDLVRSTQGSLKEAIERLGSPTYIPKLSTSALSDATAAIEPLKRIIALAAESDLESLECFAAAREVLSAIPGDFVDRLDEAFQNLDLESAHLICEDMLSRLTA